MPRVRANDPSPIALFISDTHFCHRPPIARSAEPDWYAAMRRQLEEITRLSRPNATEQLPIILAGDVFDKWDQAPAELVNFLIREMPVVYAVPGQHDLPYHDYDNLHRSPYWTLVEAGKIIHIDPKRPREITGRVPLMLHGFPFGFPLRSCSDKFDIGFSIAVIHKMVWSKNTGHIGAKNENHVDAYAKDLRGYDFAVFGDNHTPFSCKLSHGCKVWNCGSFMRRRHDEREHKPSVGILHSDGVIHRHHLDVSLDKFLEDRQLRAIIRDGKSLEGFIDRLGQLSDAAISFQDAVHAALDELKVGKAVRAYILSAMEDR